MTRLYDDPKTFTEDMLAGFLDVNARYVAGVPGGVVRAHETPPGKVAVVIGGGSGHYPAFCGVVGPGFADGAVVGNIFTSPSAEEAYSVGKAASGGGGVLFSTGNYAGDVMHFTEAKERLEAEGIDTRLVFVTDDVASAPLDEIEKRRGIAGDFVVFKIAGAAAEEGYGLDEVERVARRANDRTRTLGVAFAGCTLPGADRPLFSVPEGRMGVGLGIHGEPGVSEDDLPRASDLARRLVEGVLAEQPADAGPRVGAILNGLGTTKYEELFVVWRSVSALLEERGLTVVDPEVGELVTSLDMSGCSLTVVFLDDELERLWCAPADSPAYRKGGAVHTRQAAGSRRRPDASAHAQVESDVQGPVAGSPASRACAATTLRALEKMASAIGDAEEELGRIDAVAGDGDHGRGMVKGVTAAVSAARPVVEAGGGVNSLLSAAGEAWAAKAGGTSGALWGAALRGIGDRLGDETGEITATDVAAAIRAGLDALQRLGKAQVGDKTMVDALLPAIEALREGGDLAEALRRSADAAETGMRETAPLEARKGRASYLGPRSVGHQDPGATSSHLLLRAAAQAASGS